MKVDWSLPIELDDGRPATVVRTQGNVAIVKSSGAAFRNGTKLFGQWWYRDDGVWEGASVERAFVVRNVELSSEIHEVLL